MYEGTTLPASSEALGSTFTTRPTRTIRAALMARCSTAEQVQGYGIRVQVDAGTAYISQQTGWNLPPDLVFVDEGVSGSIIDRPEMLRLEAAAQAGLIDVIVVHKFDRIGRTGRAFWAWVWAMEDLGISFVSVTQNVDTTTQAGKQQLQFYAMMAEAEWNAIRDRTMDGRNTAALMGRWPGGPAPYGHQIEGLRKNKVLTLNPGEVLVIETAAKLIIDEGMNASEAARELNAQDMLTRTGKSWNGPNLLQRLKSESLNGTVVYRDPNKPGRGGKGRTKLNIDGTPLHGDTVTIQVPRVLGAERYAELQEALRANAQGPRRNGVHVYPLSRRIASGCGKHYIGGYIANVKTRYYICAGRKADQPCECKGLNAGEVEASVWGDIASFLGDRPRLERLAADWVKSLPGDTAKQRERVAKLEKKVSKQEGKLEKAAIKFATIDDLDEDIQAAALNSLNKGLKVARQELEEARGILAKQEREEASAREVLAVIDAAQLKQRDFTLEEMRDVMTVLDIKVEIKGEIGSTVRPGVACRVSDWHSETGAPIPDPVSEEEWPALQAVINKASTSRQFVRKGGDLRLQINGILHRLRTRCGWEDVPEQYGPCHAVKSRQLRLWDADAWPAIVAHLNQRGGGSVVPPARVVPDLVIRGRLGVPAAEMGAASRVGVRASTGRPTQ